MNEILNKLPHLIKSKDGYALLEPVIYLTAWSKWAISYRKLDYIERPKKWFTVVIEPDRDPVRIENTFCLTNEYIGNAPTFEEAVTMIVDYISENYTIEQ